MKPLFLVGYMGCGKSTLGRKLARRLGVGFVDTDALADALAADKLWGAGIDVFEHEPVSPDAPIMHAPHTVLTSHAAYWSEESAVELRRRCTQNAIDVVLGRTPEACVNPEALPAALAK